MKFSSHDSAAAAQLTRNEDGIPTLQLLAVLPRDLRGEFYLTAGDFRSIGAATRVGSREHDEEKYHRIAVVILVLLGLSNQDAAEEQSIESQPRVLAL